MGKARAWNLLLRRQCLSCTLSGIFLATKPLRVGEEGNPMRRLIIRSLVFGFCVTFPVLATAQRRGCTFTERARFDSVDLEDAGVRTGLIEIDVFDVRDDDDGASG